MISIEEIKELINGLGLKIEENGAFINGFYDGLCLVIYDKDDSEASVWNRQNGFTKNEEDIEIVRKKIVTWIQLLKQQQMDIKMEKINEMF